MVVDRYVVELDEDLLAHDIRVGLPEDELLAEYDVLGIE